MFDRNNLSVHSYSSGQTVWYYNTRDTLKAVMSRNYISDSIRDNHLTDMITSRDVVYISHLRGVSIMYFEIQNDEIVLKNMITKET